MAPTLSKSTGLLVTQSWFVQEKTGTRYEIEAWPADKPLPALKAARKPSDAPPAGTLVFVTRDELLYDEAIAFEGSSRPVTIAWHHAKDEKGGTVKVAAGLTADGRRAHALVGEGVR